MPSVVLAKALQLGDTIAFISPSARLNHQMPTVITRAEEVLSSQGYNVRTIYTLDSGIQSSISNRLSEIRTAFFDPTIAAVICTIGGTWFTELLPSLVADTELHAHIRENPKLVIGYSDITGLHWFLNAFTGLRTFYGPCPLPELGAPEAVHDESAPLAFCLKNLIAAIAKREPIGDVARSPIYAPHDSEIFKTGKLPTKLPEFAPTKGWKWLRPGKAQGRLFGGCLTVVARLNGVPSIRPDWRGRIVFLETAGGDGDVKPLINRVQAGFADMIAQGVFDEAAGLVIGRACGYDSDEDMEELIGVIKGLFCEGRQAGKAFPILFNIDIGHATPIVTLPYDTMAELDSEKDRFAIIESAVA